jgi:hypothetical protein
MKLKKGLYGTYYWFIKFERKKNLNKICKCRSFHIIKFGSKNEAGSSDALPVGLCDHNLEDQLLEVGVGH